MPIFVVALVDRTGVVLEASSWLSPPGFMRSSGVPSGYAELGRPSGTPAGPSLRRTG